MSVNTQVSTKKRVVGYKLGHLEVIPEGGQVMHIVNMGVKTLKFGHDIFINPSNMTEGTEEK